MKLSIVLGIAAILLDAVEGQSVDSNGCLRLLGSAACPAFSNAYINPSNLSNAFPFFGNVKDVPSFDAGAFNYFSDIHQFKTTKFINQLSCYNASSAVIRWERTVLCSQWVNEMWSAQCLGLYNGSSAATSQKMVCQSTCHEYANNENDIVAGAPFCPGPDESNGNRTYQLNKDFTDCTNWTTLATNETDSCILGQNNEGNCGFAGSTSQLCAFCSGDSPEACCYNANTDMSVCGYSLPAQTSSAPGTANTASSDNSGHTSKGLSGGSIAGIVVGSIVGALLILGFIGFLFFRRRRQNQRDSAASFGNKERHGSYFGGPRHPGQPVNSSEKGLLGGDSSAAAHSSPTMGDSTSAMGKHDGRSDSATGAMLGGAAAGATAGAMLAPGERRSERNSGNIVALPRVRDENQDGEVYIEEGAEVNVLWAYEQSLPDELDLRPGMKVRVLRLFDDGWGQAEVTQSSENGEGSDVGRAGAFPIVCVSEGTSPASSASHGTSSLGSH